MEHYKKVAKYWRNSLIDKQFSQGKYKSSDIAKFFLLNRMNAFFRVNSKKMLQSLSSNEDNPIEILHAPFLFKKITCHTNYEKDYRPEIFFPIMFKVHVSYCGFIYPVEKPIIPRDLLLPLDREDFFIGSMDDYDLYMTQNNISSFEFSESSKWEKYYSENIESEYQKGLIDSLLGSSLIDEKQINEDYKKIVKSLSKSKTTKIKFFDVLNEYNDEWDKTIQDRLTNDLAFNESIVSYLTKWNEYLDGVDKLLNYVVKSKERFHGYEKVNYAYFTNGELDVSSKITAVYEDIYIRDEETGLNLFQNYATIEQESERPVINSDAFFSKRVGYNNNKHSLSDAQRTAVSALIEAKQGEILAVNGPPGTGKTTMLLSIVACLWVENALKETEPPIIIANSTNNQAVTNIIDSFAKDFSKGDEPFAGRWIDGVDSFGSYFVSNMRLTAAKEKKYLTEDILKRMETYDFYIQAKASYLKKAQKTFNNKNITVKEVVRELHQRLSENKAILNRIEDAYRNYHNLKIQSVENSDFDYKSEKISELSEMLEKNEKDMEAIEKKWERFLESENLFLFFFSFLPFVRAKRNLKAKVYAEKNDFSKYLQVDNIETDKLLSAIKAEKENIHAKNERIKAFINAKKTYVDALKELKEPKEDIDPDLPFIEMDKKADMKIRFEMFLIATHYWEGRWLLDMEQLIDNGHLDKTDWKYKNIRENNWKRRMKITPCAVMTSYMLPSYFSFSRKIHDNVNKVSYLYDFIDLLIVDEAGQVPPEVAGAGFALAKKALVIGDTLQIPPISKLTKSIDMGNLHKAELLSKKQTLNEIDKVYKELQLKGIASDGGSVMRISQNRSKYYPEKKLERGLYLYEHRRCYDDIIEYCNELCYKGILKPVRGVADSNAFLPSIGYLNIEGKCQDALGSKKNELEAKMIAGWIISKYKQLRDTYGGKEIKEIISVVTPFREQARIIAGFLKQSKKENIKAELSQITVGTVHSLQGAERDIVLFSPTYSRHNKGHFIDKDKSMLNVAVSRAKDSFLVFGDMSLFDRQSTSPSGILAKYLFANENNELCYVHQYSKMFARHDLVAKESPMEVLMDYKEHDIFLKNIVSKATRRIIITRLSQVQQFVEHQ